MATPDFDWNNWFNEWPEIQRRIKAATARLEKHNALAELTKKDNPYYPLIRVMIRLKLVTCEWFWYD